MRYTLVRPCAHCPFRTDIEPYLRRGRAREIAEALLDRQQTFQCHETVDYTEDDAGRMDTPTAQHCAGAMIALEHMGRPNQMMRIAERLGCYDRSRLDMAAPVFTDLRQFVAAQEEPCRRGITSRSSRARIRDRNTS